MKQIVTNPSLAKANSIFIRYANNKKTRIINPENAHGIWPFISQMIQHYGSSEIDVNNDKSMNLFQKTGWIECRIFESMEVNACAFRIKGLQFLVFNIGLLLLIRDTFHSLFSTKEFLPEVGNAQNENLSLEQFSLNYYKSRLKGEYFQSIPLDEKRKICAEKMTELALHFIFSHEATHIAFCHSDFLQTQYKLNEYEENPTIIVSLDEQFDRRCLELAADTGASRFTLMWQKQTWLVNEKYFGSESALTIWLYSISILFKILEPQGMFIESKRRGHPNHLIRMINIQKSGLKEAVNEGLVKSLDDIHTSFKRLHELHLLFKSINFYPIDVGDYEDNIEKLIQYEIRLDEIETLELPIFRKERHQIIQNDYEWLLSQKLI